MPSSAQNHHGAFTTPRARNGEPQIAPLTPIEPGSAKRDLTSWWKQFSKRNAKKEEEKGTIHRLYLVGLPLAGDWLAPNIVAMAMSNRCLALLHCCFFSRR